MAVLANPLRHSDGPLAFAFGALIWIAVSIAMHSFPSTGDASSIWQAVWEKGAPVSARLVGTPLVALIFAEAIGSVFWLDLLYGQNANRTSICLCSNGGIGAGWVSGWLVATHSRHGGIAPSR